MNKRLLGGLLAAGIIGGGVYGFAATLEPTSDNLGAGGDDVASCDSDGFDVSYTSSYTAEDGYVVSTVELSGIAPACEDEGFQITLSDDLDGSLTEVDGTIGAATTQSVPVTEIVLAQDVEGIDVVVTGDNA